MLSPTTTKSVALPYEIHITVNNGHATLSSRLHEQLVDAHPSRDDPGMACVHALESLLLALAARNVDLGTPAAALAVQDAVEAVAEYLCYI